MPPVSYVFPVRYSAWLAGDLGQEVSGTLAAWLRYWTRTVPRLTVLPRSIAIDDLDACDLPNVLAAMDRAAHDLAAKYPVLHHQMGPIFTDMVQVVPKEV